MKKKFLNTCANSKQKMFEAVPALRGGNRASKTSQVQDERGGNGSSSPPIVIIPYQDEGDDPTKTKEN